MPAKRLPNKTPRSKPWILQAPEEPEPEPLEVSCPACGAKAPLTEHVCPKCGQLFYERPHGKVPREHPSELHAPDPSIEEFAERMDRAEKWTRVLCVIGGVVFLLIAVVSFLAVVPFGIGGRECVLGALIFGVLAFVCLKRGLTGQDADLGFLAAMRFWRR